MTIFSSYVFTVILDLRSKTPVTQEFKTITLNPNILLNFTTPLIHHPFINFFINFILKSQKSKIENINFIRK